MLWNTLPTQAKQTFLCSEFEFRSRERMFRYVSITKHSEYESKFHISEDGSETEIIPYILTDSGQHAVPDERVDRQTQ